MTEVKIQRADAIQNRERILIAARSALNGAEGVSMHTIAKLADVGQATLYRNFPSIEALLLALHLKSVTSVIQMAPAMVAEHEPALAFRLWIHRLVATGHINTGLGKALRSLSCSQLRDEGYQVIIDTIDLLLNNLRESGERLQDLNGEDIIRLIGFVWDMPCDETNQERATRLLDLVLDAFLRSPSIREQ